MESEKGTSKKSPSGTLYAAMSRGALLANGGLTDTFYIDSRVSDHLIPSKGELRTYKESAKPVEIAPADSGKIYAYSTGTLCVAAFASGLEREEDLQDAYYAPGVHVPLVSLGELDEDRTSIHARAEWSCEIEMGTCSLMSKGEQCLPDGTQGTPPKGWVRCLDTRW